MKQLLLPLLCMLLLLGGACSRQESADAGDLLATVPADASTVAVANLRTLLEKADCKIEGSEIQPGAEALRVAKSLSDEKCRRLATLFLSGKSGIEPSVAIIFTEGDALYTLTFLADPDQFRKSVSEQWGGAFSDIDGISVNDNVAIKGNLCWVRLDGRSAEPDDIKRFATLSERQSIMSSPLSESLVKIDKDIEGWGNISGIINSSGLEFTQRGMLTMALQTLLDDPSDISFSVDFKKGEAEAHSTVLNSKGKPSKLLIPSGTLDLNTIKSVEGNGEFVIAAALPQKLIKDLTKEMKGNGPSLMAVILQALSPLDGTAAFIGSGGGTTDCSGVITTTGENLVNLTDLLNQAQLKVNRDGKFLRVSAGKPSGVLTMERAAPLFKGAMMGVMVAGQPTTGEKPASAFPATTAITLTPADGGISLDMTMTADPDQNFLLSALRNTK